MRSQICALTAKDGVYSSTIYATGECVRTCVRVMLMHQHTWEPGGPVGPKSPPSPWQQQNAWSMHGHCIIQISSWEYLWPIWTHDSFESLHPCINIIKQTGITCISLSLSNPVFPDDHSYPRAQHVEADNIISTEQCSSNRNRRFDLHCCLPSRLLDRHKHCLTSHLPECYCWLNRV